MIRNYFKIAWRNIRRNRSFSMINLLGLTIGITCCLLIMIWVVDEMSYDKWNDKADRIYRLTSEVNFGENHTHYAVTPAPLAKTLVSDFPEVETAARFRGYGSALVKHKIQNFNETEILRADSTIFDVFSIELLEGNSKEALKPDNSIVISESAARKYFPNDEAMGKTLTFNDRTIYNINGIFKDLPHNTHFKADFLISLSGNERANDDIWVSHNFHTYYVLREGADALAFEAKAFPHLLEKYIAPSVEQIFARPYQEFAEAGSFVKYHIQPLTDIYLKSDLAVELGANGNITYVWIFGLAALFILLIACVNFMNLSTAASTIRAKEIGIRKVLGSLRKNLINQFLAESILMSALAFIVGIFLAQLALPYYNVITDKQLSLPFDQVSFWIISLVGMLVIGLVAGSYPAFYLSGFQPIKTITKKFQGTTGSMNLRNGLVVFQFAIAILLIIGTFVINRQMNFIQNKKLGYEKDQVLILDNVRPLEEKSFLLKEELLKNPQIKNVTISGYLPIPSYRSDIAICKDPQVREDNCVSMQFWGADEDYIPTFGMEVLMGRNFSVDRPTDSTTIIINERAAELFGFDDPIGKEVFLESSFDKEDTPMDAYKIIGVIKDFHYESLRSNIGALGLRLDPYPGNISLNVSTDNVSSLIQTIERSWKTMAPGLPFSYRFMDDSFDQLYRKESRISKIIGIFSGLSIFIACLGLFGLTAFAMERRTKEIGIRKVLGATTSNLIALLSKDFLRLVLIALIIAIPIAWYGMNQWLQDFAYRTQIGWWIFALAGIAALVIAFVTISLQSVKAAMANPIKSLRNE